MKNLYTIILFLCITMLFACGTTDNAMREQGHTDSYIQGFHDGRHSGMKEEVNNFEHYIRDVERFKTDSEYKEGWVAGEAEGKRLQKQADEVGAAAGGAYSGAQINKEVKKEQDFDKIGKNVLNSTDTSDLEALEK